jgi:hypothetical protein
LRVAQRTDDEERRYLALIEPRGELDMDLNSIVLGAHWTPCRVVAGDLVSETEIGQRHILRSRVKILGSGILVPKCDKPVLWVAPANRSQRRSSYRRLIHLTVSPADTPTSFLPGCRVISLTRSGAV